MFWGRRGLICLGLAGTTFIRILWSLGYVSWVWLHGYDTLKFRIYIYMYMYTVDGFEIQHQLMVCPFLPLFIEFQPRWLPDFATIHSKPFQPTTVRLGDWTLGSKTWSTCRVRRNVGGMLVDIPLMGKTLLMVISWGLMVTIWLIDG